MRQSSMYTETHKKDYAGAKVTAVTYFGWSFTSSQHQILLCFVTRASSTMIKEGPKIVTLSRLGSGFECHRAYLQG